MLNRKLIVLVFVVVGCSKPPETVFVDLSLVPIKPPIHNAAANIKPEVPPSISLDSKTIPGVASMEVENLRSDEKIAIRKEVDKETNDAIGTISRRLQDYYSREIDDFYKTEFAKLVPFKKSLVSEYLIDIRGIFEEAANKRGPLLTRLSFLTEFPPPEQLIPIDGENRSPGDIKRRTEIRDLQRKIIAIDQEYEANLTKRENRNSVKLDQETEAIRAKLIDKQKEIDRRASSEAERLVKRFSSSLSQRIFSRYTFQLKEIPTKTVNFPKMNALPQVPGVTFDGTKTTAGEKEELGKELVTFLSLNRYQRVPKPDGAKNVTKEFIEWRTNLKSGHWENWQKSSAQK